MTNWQLRHLIPSGSDCLLAALRAVDRVYRNALTAKAAIPVAGVQNRGACLIVAVDELHRVGPVAPGTLHDRSRNRRLHLRRHGRWHGRRWGRWSRGRRRHQAGGRLASLPHLEQPHIFGAAPYHPRRGACCRQGEAGGGPGATGGAEGVGEEGCGAPLNISSRSGTWSTGMEQHRSR